MKGHWPCPCKNSKRLRTTAMKFLMDLRGKISERILLIL